MSESTPTQPTTADETVAGQTKPPSASSAADEISPYPGPAGALSRQVRPRKALKTAAWRLTAAAVWLKLLCVLLLGAAVVDRWQAFFSWLVGILSSTGFAPVNPTYLRGVIEVGWILIITGFNPLELVGLPIYVFFAPVWALLYLWFRDELLQTREEEKKSAKSLGLVSSMARWPGIVYPSTLLLAWFLLYGDAPSRRAACAGVLLAGILLMAFTYQALRRARPLQPDAWAPFGGITQFSFAIASSMKDQEKKNPALKKMEARLRYKFYLPFRNLFRRLAAWCRGRRGSERIYVLVLSEYVVFFGLLGLSAVLFWGLMLRAVALPAIVPLRTCLMVAASYFLPGMDRPSSPVMFPFWARIGPSLTAWVLFVLFVGPAASLLPERQRAYAKRLSDTYRVLRALTVAMTKYLRYYTRVGSKLHF